MGRVFFTGDLHGDITKLIRFIERFNLTSEDSIIVLGDAALLWRNDKKDFKITLKNWELCSNGVHLYFIDGNHENFKLLNHLPIDENNMGVVSETIHYLRRGQTYTFNNKKVLVCGGADSIDKFRRTEGLSWWPDEAISEETIDGISAGHYDYVLTHCCPRSVFENNRVYLITLSNIDQDYVEHQSEDMLEKLKNKITFDKWYFGHYHIDKKLDDNFRCYFNDFEEMK